MPKANNKKALRTSQKLPLIPLRAISLFPGETVYITLGDREDRMSALIADGKRAAFLLQRGPKNGLLTETDFFETGVIASVDIVDDPKSRDFVIKVTVDCRADVSGIRHESSGYYATAEPLKDDPLVVNDVSDAELNAYIEYYINFIVGTIKELVSGLPDEVEKKMLDDTTKSRGTPSLFADNVASAFLLSAYDKQRLLEELSVPIRLKMLATLLDAVKTKIAVESSSIKTAREEIDNRQRRFFLYEQYKAIKAELAEDDDFPAFLDGMDGEEFDEMMRRGDEEDEEIAQYRKKLESLHSRKFITKEVYEKINKEISRLYKLSDRSSDANVMRGYLDTVFELPWGKFDNKSPDFNTVKKILEHDHYGLQKVKERILEFVAVKENNAEAGSQIICLVGAPGVGKTSVAASIAKSLGRKYVRVSLGGVRDESDIRGHRKTYVASMPGRIVEALTHAGSMNPLILLDEIDKMGHDFRGDPSSALLEVLDSEQNKAFRDHFLELPLDLSSCVFVATANTLESVPRPLLDRMEIIELPIYNRNDKLNISKNHLIPKQLKRHNLTKSRLKIDDSAILTVVDSYTHEAGVRGLEREIAALCRKATTKFVENPDTKNIKINSENLHSFLGAPKIIPERLYEKNEIGIVNGLAFTETGGELLRIEAVSLPGTGKLELTGSLGEVMRESAKIAVSYIRLIANDYGIDPDFYKNRDLHIHFPDGATPKDGPSAGAAIVCALCSELSGIPVRRDAALTGEVTLHGRVTAIGGLREKTMAAYRAGVKTVLVPEENRKNLADIDDIVKSNLEISFYSSAKQAIERLLEQPLPIKKLENKKPSIREDAPEKLPEARLC